MEFILVDITRESSQCIHKIQLWLVNRRTTARMLRLFTEMIGIVLEASLFKGLTSSPGEQSRCDYQCLVRFTRE